MKKIIALALLFSFLSMPVQAKVLVQQVLYQYAARGDIAKIKQLQERGYSIDSPNYEGNTALCDAVLRRNNRAANILIKMGADRNAKCMQRISNYYKNISTTYASKSPVVDGSESSGTFLGMGATGWTVAGVVAAGAGVAIAAGSGGGGSSHSSGGGTLNCHHGKQVGDSCQCYAGYTGTQCEDKVDCSGYYSICPAGYDKGSNTCQSGEDILYKCDVEKVCPYTTTSCSTGYHETGNTCQSGTKIYVECEANTCTGYDYTTCPTGYAQSDSCQAGDIIKIKCDNCDTGYEKDASGKCVPEKGEDIYGRKIETNNTNVNIDNQTYADVYGLYSANDTRNAFSDRYNYIYDAHGNINITNEADGDIYGVYGKNTYNAVITNDNFSTGSININNVGNGSVFGLHATKNAENALADNETPEFLHTLSLTAQAVIDVSNEGDGDVYGIYAGQNAYNSRTFNQEYTMKKPISKGIIKINNIGHGNVYGLYSEQGNVYNSLSSTSYLTSVGEKHKANGDIYIYNDGTGNAYGLYSKNGRASNAESSAPADVIGKVELINKHSSKAIGIFGRESYNGGVQKFGNATGSIKIANIGDGTAIGMYGSVDNQSDVAIDNSGDITIHNLGNGAAIGLYVNKGTALNYGNITITRTDYTDNKATDGTSDDETYTATSAKGGTAIGIYGASDTAIQNSGTITIDGADTSYGIYAETGATVTNSGTITIDGTSCTGSNCTSANNAIVLNGGKLFQDGVLQAQSLSLNDFGGEVIANSNAKFVVKDNISGDLAINNNVVQDGFDTTYKIANMVEAGDTSGLNLKSQSALFDAKLENNSDAVMEMKAFNSVVKDESVAEFLQNNYAAQNNEKLYQTLKSSETVASLNSNVDALFGKEMFSRMAFEDISMLREINFDMNQNLFNQPEGYFALGGNISPSNYDSNLGSVGRYSLNGYNDGKRSFAIGMSIADIRTDNGNGANNRFDRSFVMSAPYGYRTDNGFEFITTPKLGFTNGTYRRRGLDGMNYNGNVQKRMVALMNEARYPFDFSKMTLTAALEFNAIGYNIKGGEDDQDYSLRIKSQNHASVETGFGLTASKEINLTKDSKLKLSGGVAFYHEFANPYELELGMDGMSGTYKMRNDKYGDNRTVVRFGLDYQLQDYLDVTANLLSNIDKETRTDASVDMKYNF